MKQYKPPSFQSSSFSCPHCHVLATQRWFTVYEYSGFNGSEELYDPLAFIWLSECENPECGERSVWIHGKLGYPCFSTAPLPYADMPSDVKEDFLEAREVFEVSPRAAAALLRLALQKLMKHLRSKGREYQYGYRRADKRGFTCKD